MGRIAAYIASPIDLTDVSVLGISQGSSVDQNIVSARPGGGGIVGVGKRFSVEEVAASNSSQ